MNTTALIANIVLIVFGLLTCFFGIWFRKVNAAIMGLILGLCAGILVISNTGIKQDSDWALIIPVAIGAVLAVLSAIFDRFYIVIAGFITGALAAFFILGKFFPENVPIWVNYVTAASIGLACAVLGYFLYGKAYAFLAALDGAFVFTASALAIALPLAYSDASWFKSTEELPFVAPIVPGALTDANAATNNEFLWATIVLLSVTVILTVFGIICQHKKAKKVD